MSHSHSLRVLIVGIIGIGQAASGAGGSTCNSSTWRNSKDGMQFVWIPAGSLVVEFAQGAGQQQPPAPTRMTPAPTAMTFAEGFWLGRKEVTLGQFGRFVEQTGHVTEPEKANSRWTWRNPGFPQTDEHPVGWLGFGDAVAYARWAGVDLPTEGEWLYACKAATTTKFYWGDQIDDRHVWHRDNAGDGTRPVAQKLPNPWGLHDMVGNAHEWCRSGEYGVLRGGSWTRSPRYQHVSGDWVEPFDWEVGFPLHDGSPPTMYPWDDDRGFRCIRRIGPRVGDPPSVTP